MSDASVGVDTNILVYAEMKLADDSDARTAVAESILTDLAANGRLVIGAQVFAELVRVLERRYGRTRRAAVASAEQWRVASRFAPIDDTALDGALTLVARHDFRIWDALAVSAAAAAGCILLLSEDMQDGFVWRGMTIANPFAASLHPVLASLLE